MFDPEEHTKIRKNLGILINTLEALRVPTRLTEEERKERISKTIDFLFSVRDGFLYLSEGLIVKDPNNSVYDMGLFKKALEYSDSKNLQRRYLSSKKRLENLNHPIEQLMNYENKKISGAIFDFLLALLKGVGKFSRDYANQEDTDD